MGDGGDGGDSGGDANNPATSNYDPTAPVSAPSGGDSGTTTAAPADDASAPFPPVFQWVQVAGQCVAKEVTTIGGFWADVASDNSPSPYTAANAVNYLTNQPPDTTGDESV